MSFSPALEVEDGADSFLEFMSLVALLANSLSHLSATEEEARPGALQARKLLGLKRLRSANGFIDSCKPSPMNPRTSITSATLIFAKRQHRARRHQVLVHTH